MYKKNGKKTRVIERRKNVRAITALTVVRCPSKLLFENNFLSRDISEDGICLLSLHKMEIGEKVKLGIYVPELKAPIEAWGEIMRRNESEDLRFPFILGVKFLKIDESGYANICNHLRYFFLKP